MPYLFAGAVCIIGGGVLAAATAYASTEKTAWATAYLVLVGGVAQVFLGAAVSWLTPKAPARNAWLAWAGWNIGNAGVLTGQLTALIALTDVGTALLVASLVLVLASGHGVGSGLRAAAATTHRLRPRMLLAFRIVVVLLAVSMVVGVILAHVGA
ncbi:MAG: hypothetical protein BGO26_03935 [Actinobacteria bacterium 69-20]|jgi:hypothetical protein|nr:hypothetical protein [Actinomycetota bacterium]OJV23959.1 MAG: hypothetical protein BGO26_03935 [Actinobacteria bacterium 69-20]